MEEKTMLFDRLKSILSSYDNDLDVRGEAEGKYNLYGKKTVTIGKKEVEGVYFASALIQKNFVGFYFFPIYTDAASFEDIDPVLRKCLKGKSCFHVKKNDDDLYRAIDVALKKGYQLYKEKGWI